MKKIIIMFVIGLFAPQIIQAQGTTYLSNLGQPSIGSLAVGSDSWLGVPFITGTNADGYMLNSLQLELADASGNPSGFTAMLYSCLFPYYPSNSLGNLSGSTDPATGGIYTYTDDSNIILSSSTTYLIVLTAGTTVANGAYGWSVTSTPSPGYISGHWVAGDLAGLGSISTSPDGSFWRETGLFYPQYALIASAIPEPSILGLLGLGGWCFLWHRRKIKYYGHQRS